VIMCKVMTAPDGAHAEEVVNIMTASLARPMAWPYIARPITQPRVAGERITVDLLPTVTGDLRRLQKRTKLSATDLVNRSITSYEFFDAQLRAGRALLVRDSWTGETNLVQFR
jgi:hypothetical protein